MESLEKIFDNLPPEGDFFQPGFISEIIQKNLIPYFRRKGLSVAESIAKSYALMSYLISISNEIRKKDQKKIIIQIKNIRKSFVAPKQLGISEWDLFVTSVEEKENEDVIAFIPGMLYKIDKKISPKESTTFYHFIEKILFSNSSEKPLGALVAKSGEEPEVTYSREPAAVAQREAPGNGENIEVSDEILLSLISKSIGQIEQNLEDSTESLQRIDSRLEELDGSYAGNT